MIYYHIFSLKSISAIRYGELTKFYIPVEMTKIWHLHVSTVKRMTMIFATTEHINYAKLYNFVCKQW